MKILITASGGGHFAAASAVMKQLPKEYELLFVGRKYVFEGDLATPFEIQVVKEEKIPFRAIDSARLQRKLTKQTIPSLAKLPRGLLQARKILMETKPDLVVSFGGYVTVPIVFAASRMRIPVIIHEQAIEAGLANKIGSKFAKRVFISWDESRKYFKHTNIVLTGNPIRKETIAVADMSQSETRKRIAQTFPVLDVQKPLLFVTGGSSGSHALNVLVEESLDQLLDQYVIVHQTGDAQEFRDYDRLAERKNQLPGELQKRYHIIKFVDPGDISSLMHAADLVIGRAGISTVTELVFLQKKALLIPLVLPRLREQLINAAFFEKLGLGSYLLQDGLTAASLQDTIAGLLDSDIHPTEEAEEYRKNLKHATDTIVSNIQNYVEKTAHPQKAHSAQTE